MSLHERKMQEARAYVVNKAEYYASTVYGFVFVPLEEEVTMLCTPKLILGYGIKWAQIATIEELGADIVHEANHFLRGHFFRSLGVPPDIFNIGADLAENPDLRDGGWKLAADAIFPAHYGFPEYFTLEKYVELLMSGDGSSKGKSQGAGDSKKSQAPNPKSGPGGQDQKPEAQKPPPAPGNQQGKNPGDSPAPPGVGSGCCGSIAGNSPSKELEARLNAEPELGRGEIECSAIAKQTVEAMKEYVQTGRGSLPGSLKELIKKFDKPSTVRWQDELVHVLRNATGRMQAGGEDFSLRRPSKRSYMRGVPRPGLIEHLPEICIVRDSSGSMGQKQLLSAACESFHILQAIGVDEVWFADADAKVATPWKRVGPQFFRELQEAHGRCGTDFRPAIESALKLNPRPDLLIYITDGDGSTADMPPPHMEIVWVIVPSYWNKKPAEWGRTIFVKDGLKDPEDL